MSPLSQYLYCHKIRHQKDFHFLYVRGFRSVQLRLPLGSQGTCVRQLCVFPQDRHVQDLRGLQHPGFWSRIFLSWWCWKRPERIFPRLWSRIVHQMTVVFHLLRRILQRGVLPQIWSELQVPAHPSVIRSGRLISRECLIQCHICSRRPEYLQPVR